jgi:hypothetical protein
MLRFWRRAPSWSGHIIISGTGRAGTTFLVQYFTAVGMDTGFTLEQALSNIDPISFAGLERRFKGEQLPHVLKSPGLADQIDEVLRGGIEIEAAIIPIRDLFAAAESRRRVYRDVSATGRNPLRYPGTIWKTEKPAEQESYLAVQLHKLIEPLVKYGVPIHFLHYPEFVCSHDALYSGLEPILKRHCISFGLSERAYRRVADPSLVHHFSQ